MTGACITLAESIQTNPLMTLRICDNSNLNIQVMDSNGRFLNRSIVIQLSNLMIAGNKLLCFKTSLTD